MVDEKLLINKTSLKSIADAVRTKTGTTEPLLVPDGVVKAIDGIETGGSIDFVYGSTSIAKPKYGQIGERPTFNTDNTQTDESINKMANSFGLEIGIPKESIPEVKKYIKFKNVNNGFVFYKDGDRSYVYLINSQGIPHRSTMYGFYEPSDYYDAVVTKTKTDISIRSQRIGSNGSEIILHLENDNLFMFSFGYRSGEAVYHYLNLPDGTVIDDINMSVKTTIMPWGGSQYIVAIPIIYDMNKPPLKNLMIYYGRFNSPHGYEIIFKNKEYIKFSDVEILLLDE